MVLTEYTVKSDKLKVCHDVVMLSDFHNMPKAMEESLEIVRPLRPEAIFVVGDLVDRHRKKYDLALDFLQSYVDIAPTFFSYGNHECKYTVISEDEYKSTGACVLRNDFTKFQFKNGEEICVGGHDPNALPFWMDDFEKQQSFKILMCHHPENYIDRLQTKNVDLILSGHAHGGQFQFFGRGVLAPGQGLFPKYTKGMFMDKFIVGTGISNTAGIIPRLFNPTEVILIHLKGM